MLLPLDLRRALRLQPASEIVLHANCLATALFKGDVYLSDQQHEIDELQSLLRLIPLLALPSLKETPMPTYYEIENAEQLRPLQEAVTLGLRAIRIGRTCKLPNAEFTAARKAFYTNVKPARRKTTKDSKETA